MVWQSCARRDFGSHRPVMVLLRPVRAGLRARTDLNSGTSGPIQERVALNWLRSALAFALKSLISGSERQMRFALDATRPQVPD